MRLFNRKKKEEPQTPPTYKEYLLLFDLCTDEVKQEDIDILSKQPRPDKLCGKIVPQNLNGITYGQLDDLRDVSEEDDIPYAITEIIFGEVLNLLDEDVNKVFGFVNFCTKEIDRINKIFASVKPHYSQEEVNAGVEQLDFGSFGVLDWYAKRMGITDQNEVRDVPWVRIFTCMKNDHDEQMFEKRLQDQYMKPHSRPSRAR